MHPPTLYGSLKRLKLALLSSGLQSYILPVLFLVGYWTLRSHFHCSQSFSSIHICNQSLSVSTRSSSTLLLTASCLPLQSGNREHFSYRAPCVTHTVTWTQKAECCATHIEKWITVLIKVKSNISLNLIRNICIISERNNCTSGSKEMTISHFNLFTKKIFNRLKIQKF